MPFLFCFASTARAAGPDLCILAPMTLLSAPWAKARWVGLGPTTSALKEQITLLSEPPAGFIYKRSTTELPPDMRLSDQSACLVPICLSYSLFIYFHPDMQGIPDKMASLARFAGDMRADCRPSVPHSIDR